MAIEEQVSLIQEGPTAWNLWRQGNPDVRPDLSAANLSEANLSEANLRGANFDRANLIEANLREADLRGANLRWGSLAKADLSRANLSEADLLVANLRGANFDGANLRGASLKRAEIIGANLRGADLSAADLSAANLSGVILKGANLSAADLSGGDLSAANLIGANLSGANLSAANLGGVILRGVNLKGADFNEASTEYAIFGNADLSTVKGLETVKHLGPSTIGIDSLFKSEGNIPEVFLRGCGLSDWQIEAVKLHRTDLSNEEIGDILYRIHDLRAHQPLQITPLFISYSHTDDPFVNQMERYLVSSGIRFWRDVHHATAGRLERQIDRAIRLNPTVLLILSKHSVQSDWVEHEVRLARELAKQIKRDVLCPVALDKSWKDCEWPKRLREQIMEYNILDFSDWQNVPYFERMYRKLTEGLNLFYTKKE